MNRENISQLVQDVIDGKESPQKAWTILNGIAVFIDDCLDEVEKYITDADNKNTTES